MTTDTRKERSVDFCEKGVALRGGIPTSKDGDVDMLAMCLHIYTGKIEDDLSRMNEEGFGKKAGWKLVTHHEWVVSLELSTQLGSSVNWKRDYGRMR
jgi:hypothetical protein